MEEKQRTAKMKRKKWSGGNIKKLRTGARFGVRQAAETIGLAESSYINYETGRTMPPMDALVAIADFYQVPVDYVIGRSDINGDPLKKFYAARRAAYEDYVSKKKFKALTASGAAIDWPYNLYEAIFEKAPKALLTADQVDGMEYAVDALKDMEKNSIRQYYREGKSLEEIGKQAEMTREGARQAIRRGLHKLKREPLSTYITKGMTGTKVLEETHATESMVERLRDLKAEYESLMEIIQEKRESLNKLVDREDLADTMLVEDMFFSVRTFTCLRLARVTSLSDIIHATASGELSRIRNLGQRGIEEVLYKIRDLTGKSYGHVYGMTLKPDDIGNAFEQRNRNMPIEYLDLSVRAYNCLKRAELYNLGDVIKCIENGEIRKIRNLGRATEMEVIEKVQKYTGRTYVPHTLPEASED